MRPFEARHRRLKSPVFAVLLLFQLVIVMLQLWLFVSVLEEMQAGRKPQATVTLIVTLVCLGVNAWMLVGVRRLDRAE